MAQYDFKDGDDKLVARARGSFGALSHSAVMNIVARALRCPVTRIDLIEERGEVTGRVTVEVIGPLASHSRFGRTDLDNTNCSGPIARMRAIEAAVAQGVRKAEMAGRTWSCELQEVHTLTPQMEASSLTKQGGGVFREDGSRPHGKRGFTPPGHPRRPRPGVRK